MRAKIRNPRKAQWAARRERVARGVASSDRVQLTVYRTAKHMYAQLVDDQRGVTIAGAADTSEGMQIEGKGKVARSFALGRLIAAKAKEKGIGKVVFDRGGYQYHGRVKAVADGARKGGLEF